MITQNDIDILNFIHNRLVEKYKENPNVDYLIKAREVIGYLQQELVSGVIASHEQALPIQRVSNSLLSLDGKTIPVTFHVSKFKPKIDIDLSNDC